MSQMEPFSSITTKIKNSLKEDRPSDAFKLLNEYRNHLLNLDTVNVAALVNWTQLSCDYLVATESWCKLSAITICDLESELEGLVFYWYSQNQLPSAYMRYFNVLQKTVAAKNKKTNPHRLTNYQNLLRQVSDNYFDSNQKISQVWTKWFQNETNTPKNNVKRAG